MKEKGEGGRAWKFFSQILAPGGETNMATKSGRHRLLDDSVTCVCLGKQSCLRIQWYCGITIH